MIKILFFGRLRELLKCNDMEYSIADEPVPLFVLRKELMAKGAEWDEFLSPQQALVAVNQNMADDTVMVKSGDEVAFFPPVTGG